MCVDYPCGNCVGCNELKHDAVKEFSVKFDKIADVKDFVIEAEKITGKVAVVSHDNYVCNGKSIMGIFGLNLSEPVRITVDKPSDGAVLFNFCQSREIVT